ncbi:MAG: hypothetical protein A2Z86_05175 [Candidatus Glassbacteria bacterium GWA2_58_10]|uniref:Malonyl-[acyl-carrier protein] O-methyltransferase n=1 Tax=Candidatus Glassbacteria bacterium GWA2_58_10 TaxID=1817865 RepID=A0A1F5YDG5_9BACT|nr:MAG: hypothetical protein A2Z86_05175 [Candidatus Glassbacteria bacterium GWA2_58_10]
MSYITRDNPIFEGPKNRKILDKINKKIVALHFSAGAKNYQALGGIQREIAFQLAEWADLPQPASEAPLSVLEIGCGTGNLTGFLLDKIRPGFYLGLDLARGMLETAAGNPDSREDRVRLIQADGEKLPFRAESFDLVASSTTFQWFGSLEDSLAGINRVLRPGGSLRAATLGGETFRELREAYRTIAGRMGITLTTSRYGPPLPEAQELKDSLNRAGFRRISLQRSTKYEYFPGVAQFMRSIKKRGANNPNYRPMSLAVERRFMKEVLELYEQRFRSDGQVYAGYEVLFLQCRKE